MTSPLLTTPGAVKAESTDEGVAAHYGDPTREGRAIERSVALVDRSNRGVVRVSGPDRLGWLNNLTSQLTEGLPAWAGTEALVMDAKGHLKHHLSLVDDGEAAWIHTEPGGAAALAQYLDSMRFMMRVEIADLSESRAVLTVLGPDRDNAVAALDTADIPVRASEYESDLFVPVERLKETADVLIGEGAKPAGMWAYEANRIAEHRVRPGVDTDERTIPHEVDWVGRAVHLEKGCYPGQETVARVHNLGRPPRRLVLLHLDGTAERLPGVGSDIELDGRKVGRVGSSARHHELGPIALGVVKRNAPTDADFTVEEIAASQEIVVDPDTGANAQINLRRRPR